MSSRQGWKLRSAMVIASVIGLFGCGKDTPGVASAGSCTVVDSGFTTCFDYTGSGYTTATAQTACSNTNSGTATGTYSTSACTTSGRVGSCKLYSGQVTEEYVRYFGGYNNTTAATSCSGFSGTYTSG